MKAKPKKTPADYPTATIRVPADLLFRIETAARKNGVSKSAFFVAGARRHIVDFEKLAAKMPTK